MRTDAFGSEDPVRDVMRGLIPAIDPPLDVIDTRASRLRRRFRLRMAGLAGALVIGTVATAGALTGGASKSAVEVANRHGRHSKIMVTPTTSATTRVTRPKTATTVTTPASGMAPGQPTNPTPGATTPNAGPAPIIVPGPTTPRTSPHGGPSPTTVTTAPSPKYPPIIPSHPRMTVVLDDAGLHAPTTFAVGSGGYIEILFLDQRSHPTPVFNKPNGTAYLYSTGLMFSIERWDGSQDELFPWEVSPGALVLQASDGACYCDIAGASVTVTLVAP